MPRLITSKLSERRRRGSRVASNRESGVKPDRAAEPALGATRRLASSSAAERRERSVRGPCLLVPARIVKAGLIVVSWVSRRDSDGRCVGALWGRGVSARSVRVTPSVTQMAIDNGDVVRTMLPCRGMIRSA